MVTLHYFDNLSFSLRVTDESAQHIMTVIDVTDKAIFDIIMC